MPWSSNSALSASVRNSLPSAAQTTFRKKTEKFFAKPSDLYVSRKLLNSDEFISWAKDQGFVTTLQPGDLHVTVMYSKTSLIWPRKRSGGLIIKPDANRSVAPLGDGGAIVLKFESPILEGRWSQLKDKGFIPSWPTYQPHVIVT